MDVGGNIGGVLNQKSGEIYSVAPDAMVFEAIKLMAEKNVGALLVMKGQKLVGVLSERDYTRKVFLRGKSSKETRVDEIMSKDVFTTSLLEGVDKCLALMTDKHIRHLPVLETGKVVGVVSIGD
ncbi:MAG TPA: CBS domain-containing protein, partial [Chthoniobacterales bacterium]